MKILFWDNESEALNDFLTITEKMLELVGIDDLASINSSIEEYEEIVCVLFDYDSDKKNVDKTVKQIRKNFDDLKVILISNSLTSKQLAKHQSSKSGADLYLRTPINTSLVQSLVSSLLDIEVVPKKETVSKLRTLDLSEDDEVFQEDDQDNDYDELSTEEKEMQNRLVQDHTRAENISERAMKASQNLDKKYLEVFPETSEEQTRNQVLSDILSEEELDKIGTIEDIDLDDEVSLSDEISLDEDVSLDEEILLTEDDNSLDLRLDEGTGDINTEELSLDPLDEEDESPLLPSEDDLTFPDIGGLASELKSEKEEPDMSGHDENDLELDGMEELELGEEDLADGEVIDTDDDLDMDLGDDLSLDLSSEEDENTTMDVSSSDELDLSVDGDSLELGEDDDFEAVAIVNDEVDLSDDLSGDSLELGEVESGESEENFGDLSLGGDDESLELGGDDESLELGGDDESLELGSDDNSVDINELNLELGEEVDVDENDISFGEASESDEPDVTSLEAEVEAVDEGESFNEDASLEFNISNDLEGEPSISTDAQQKLAEIDAMMLDSEVDHSEFEELDDQTNSNIENSSQEVEEPEEINFSNNSNEDFSEEEVTEIFASENNEIDDRPALQEEVSVRTDASQQILSDHKVISQHNNDELIRLGETIKNLKDDRESLIEKIAYLENKKESEVKDSHLMRAELDEKKIEVAILKKRYSKQIEDIKVQLDISESKKEILEERNKQFQKEYEELNRTIRVDLNKVRTRERELENKLELLKSDSEVQIRNRDHKILELKRKIDTLEFDLESLQSQGKKIVNNKYQLEEKMEKVIQTLRVAIGDLEEDSTLTKTIENVKKNLDV